MQYCTSSDKKIRDEYKKIRDEYEKYRKVQKQRKTRRAAKKSYGDKIVEKEGETYVLGGF